jgi:polyisoprenyl-teichoic acid--peptidoglycan teichoic acid transferase
VGRLGTEPAEPRAQAGDGPGVRAGVDRRRRGLGRALLLTAGSLLLPGLAHLRAGRRLTGGLLLTGYLLLVGAAVVYALRLSRDGALRLAVQTDTLAAIIAGAGVLAVAWCVMLVSSYRAVRPSPLNLPGRLTAATVVGALCLAVVAPLGFGARNAYLQRDLIHSVFSDDKPAFKTGEDVWANKPRLNVLLLGGDYGRDRTGVRTDSMILASIDTHTGDTVLLGLPRNLQRAAMPNGPARERFPDGFTGDGAPGNNLLNAVWEYGVHHPDMVPGSDDPGPDLLKGTVGTILGQHVDYYVLVNLFGFRDIVQALGGVTIRITEPIPYGQQGRVLEPGLRKLNGNQALWYARSRTNSSDYQRMDRQRCMMGAIARQASPQVVLTRFQQIASATKKVVATDLPASLLPPLVTLAGKARTAQIDSVTFSPPLIKPHRPDYHTIHRVTAEAINSAGEPVEAKPKPPAKKTTTAAGDDRTAKPDRSGDRAEEDRPASVSVDQVCRYE